MGTKQSGILNLKISNLVKDTDILILARKTAEQLIEGDRTLNNFDNKLIKEFLFQIIQKT